MIVQKLLIDFAKQHPLLVAINVAFMSFVPVNEVWLPDLYGKMISAITDMKDVECTLIWVLMVLLIAQVGYLLRDRFNEVFVPTFENFMRTEMVNIILDKYNSDFHTLTTGDIISKLTKIPDTLNTWFHWLNDFIVPYIFVFIVATVYFWKYDPSIAISFIVFFIILFIVIRSAPQKCMSMSIKADTAFVMFHEKIEELIHNMTSIYSTNTKQKEIEGLKLNAKEYATEYKSTASCARQYKTVMIPLTIVLIGIFVLRSKILILTKKTNAKQFTSMFVILTYIASSIFWMVDIIRFGVFDLGSLSNMNAMLKELPEKHRDVMPYRPPSNYIIGLSNVSFAYEGNTILQKTNIGFEKNEITALLGAVGRGKSTILKLIMCFYIPDHGDLYFENKWYNELHVDDIRRRIGYVPQHPALFNNTILYNIRYGNEHLTEKQIIQFIESIGIDKAFSHGIHTDVGKNGMNISGGQRQLVWCLRVLLQNPEILVMDEPTASMDKNTKDLMFKILQKLMEKRTVIMVTHDPYLINFCTKKIMLP